MRIFLFPAKIHNFHKYTKYSHKIYTVCHYAALCLKENTLKNDDPLPSSNNAGRGSQNIVASIVRL